MYAVLVIAAILLSVGPMHARTLLAALPAGTPGHQFAPDQAAQAETRAHLQKATRQTARHVRATYAPTSRTPALTAPAPFTPPHLPAPASLLEHAPNAP